MSTPLKILIVIRDPGPEVAAIHQELQQRLAAYPHVSVTGVVMTNGIDPAADFNLVIAIGGDGTILRTCRAMGLQQRPIVGVNKGHLGFLTDLSVRDLMERLDQIVQSPIDIVQYPMYECRVLRDDQLLIERLGLNEVGIHAAGSMKLLSIDLKIDGNKVSTFACDGLLISTPAGSTAHALGAGGPILSPTLNAFVVVPICPHAISDRPLVESATCIFEMQATNASAGVKLSIDGQDKIDLLPTDRVIMKRAPVSFQLARLKGYSFYKSLQAKLGWSGQPVYREPGMPGT
jgi:NAD+ kinase